MTRDSLVVWSQITEAFPPLLPPQPVTECVCDECQDVRATFGHVRWDQVLPPAIEKGFGWLPLLKDEAFQGLLPAFLFHSLRDLREENKVLEWTLYTLCGSYEEDDEDSHDSHVRSRVVRLTDQQRVAVRGFLKLVGSTPEIGVGHRAAIAKALTGIWV